MAKYLGRDVTVVSEDMDHEPKVVIYSNELGTIRVKKSDVKYIPEEKSRFLKERHDVLESSYILHKKHPKDHTTVKEVSPPVEAEVKK